ncbi:hypothetical protein RQP46_009681 [Phenoliferia psychrophenolica]
MLPRAVTIVLAGVTAFVGLHVIGYASGVEPPTRAHQALANAITQSHWVAPPNLKKVVVFGDSLSDDGTGAWLFTNFTWPANPQYVGHRFSNGRIYSEYLAESLLLPLDSYAVGGASISTRVSSASGPNSSWPVDCILDQIGKYSIGKTDERQTVFVVYAGANDIFWGMDEGGTMPEVIEDLQTAIKLLKKIGGRYFIVPTLPPLGEKYPFGKALPKAAAFMGRSSKELRRLLLEWARKDKTVAIADFYDLYTDVMSHPSRYGFNPDKISNGCIDSGACVNPDEHIWFDNFHPTTRVHEMLGKVALTALDSLTGVRLPPSTLQAPSTMWKRELN